ncbi:MAG TPA: N-acetylmuramoyl-L-alanine amidase [Rubricoccaceae bacterium]|jgi:N-acetylmuramoyl-L-alanine amidase
MPVVSRSTLVALLTVLAAAPAAAGPEVARPAPTATRLTATRPAAVQAVSFEPQGTGLTVRVRTTARVESFAVEQSGRTVRLVLTGADMAPALDRGRAAPPVRDYRVEGARNRVTVTFDAPGSPPPVATQDARTSDILLTFAPTGAPATVATRTPTTRRAAGWGRAAEPVAETTRAEVPRETARVEIPRVETPVAAAPRRTPTRRSRSAADPVPAAPDPSPAGEAPVASSWQTAPPVVVPYTPEASAVYVANGNNWRLDTIVLDAGHGGHDIGATYNGVREKDVTLGIVRALGPMIERELGLRVVYTRRDDHFEELRERGRIANRSGGKLFISVHANAAGASSASGTETYFLAPHRSSSAQEVMERENAVIQLESTPDLYAEYTDQGDILQALAMSAYQEESQTLARLVEGRLVGQGRRSRGVKQAGFLVLWAASMPAILVETGFVSNPDEARLLGSASGQERTARAIFEAIAAYRDQYERGLRLAATG